MLPLGSNVSAHSVDNFKIDTFTADYYLTKDADGHSRLTTVEEIVATFPEYDQNHGIERVIPKHYDGHITNVTVRSIEDANGNKLEYTTRSEGENLIVRIGNPTRYVHGSVVYKITYAQKDVTKFFKDTNDEFYWDVNGEGWGQPIGKVTARLHMEGSVSSSATGKYSCYVGVVGSTAKCPIDNKDDKIIQAVSDNLGMHETMTIAVGFTAHTFKEYEQTWLERFLSVLFAIWMVVLIIGSIAALFLIVQMSMRWRKIKYRIKGRGTIVAEYLPPKDASVLLSAQVVQGGGNAAVSAQIIDLAVRHYVKLYQSSEKKLFRAAEYELEIVKELSSLRQEEQRLLTDVFGRKSLKPGDRFAMKTMRTDTQLSRKLLASHTQLRTLGRSKYGLFERSELEKKWFVRRGWLMLLIGIVTLSPVLITAGVLGFIFAYTLWALTDKGVALRDYLLGLKMYIDVAEKDRIKMLQSPEGAEKIGHVVADGDTVQLIKLYERVLPYAILFGLEKNWVKQLSVYYESTATQPDWYSGNGVFTAAVFTGMMSDFNTQSSTYTSSSSGESGSGGSAGGGGGGGGGGGW